MGNVFLFTYRQAIKTRWFLIMLLSGAILITVFFNMDAIMERFSPAEPGEQHIALFDRSGNLGLKAAEMDAGGGVRYTVFETEADISAITDDFRAAAYDAAIVFGAAGGMTDVYLSETLSEEAGEAVMQSAVFSTMLKRGIERGMTEAEAWSIVNPENVNVIEAPGEPATNHGGLILILIVLLYFMIMLYGTMISNSVMEEKSNRIMETLLCAARPESLLFGKVFGMLAVSVTQMAIWGLLAFGFSKIRPLAAGGVGDLGLTLSAEVFAILAVSILLGYLMYAMVFAALGSLANTSQDSTQLLLPISIVLMAVYFAVAMGIDNAHAVWFRALSYVPFAAPIATFARAIVTEMPWWEIGASILVQLVYIGFLGLLSSKIFQKGAVSYGLLSQIFKPGREKRVRRQKAVQAGQ